MNSNFTDYALIYIKSREKDIKNPKLEASTFVVEAFLI